MKNNSRKRKEICNKCKEKCEIQKEAAWLILMNLISSKKNLNMWKNNLNNKNYSRITLSNNKLNNKRLLILKVKYLSQLNQINQKLIQKFTKTMRVKSSPKTKNKGSLKSNHTTQQNRNKNNSKSSNNLK